MELTHYIDQARPFIDELIKKHHLKVYDEVINIWEHPFEGERLDFLVNLEGSTPREIVDINLELIRKLNYSLPINVTIGFTSK